MSSRTRSAQSPSRRNGKHIRYAVVGLGHIAQAAVLPAFKLSRNSRLAALVTDDRAKLRSLGRKYGVDLTTNYDGFADLLDSGEIDAVYVALPNHMHAEFAIAAARAGVHVLCEKPMAVTADECRQMIAARDRFGVKMMIAYRLHFEKANLQDPHPTMRQEMRRPALPREPELVHAQSASKE